MHTVLALILISFLFLALVLFVIFVSIQTLHFSVVIVPPILDQGCTMGLSFGQFLELIYLPAASMVCC